MVLRIAVRVFAVRQQHHIDVEPFLQEHIYTAQRGVNTGGVAVIEHRNITREPLNQPYLRLRQRRSATRHHILDPALVHGDDVHLTLHQIAHICTRNSLLGLEKTV